MRISDAIINPGSLFTQSLNGTTDYLKQSQIKQ